MSTWQRQNIHSVTEFFRKRLADGSLLIVAYCILVRLPALPPSVFDWDESIFILMGREIVHGHLPYVTLFDVKPVGIFVAFAVIMKLFGQSIIAIRLFGTVCVMASALLLRMVALRAGIEQCSAIAVGLLYAAFSTRLGGFETDTEIVLAPFIIAGVLTALRAGDVRATHRIIVRSLTTGILFGFATWIKYIAILPAAMVSFILITYFYLKKKYRVQQIIKIVTALTIGILAPTITTFAIYTAYGKYSAFWQANFGFMGAYIGESQHISWSELFWKIMNAALEVWPLLVLGIMGAGIGLFRLQKEPPFALVVAGVAWFIAEVVGVVAPGHFFYHYFLLLLPPLCVLSGVAIDWIVTSFVREGVRGRAAPMVALAVGLVPFASFAHEVTADWLNIGRPDASRRAAALIRNDPGPNHTAWVVNSEPVIYLLGQVPLPTQYAFPPHLVGSQTALSGVRPEQEVGRILKSNPRFLVIEERGWLAIPTDIRALIQSSLDAHYEKIAVEQGGHRQIAVWRWRSDAQGAAVN